MSEARPRPTQRERREATIGKLIDATIASLREVGYSGTSVKEVCARAGVSHGGLFRHFASMEQLYAAVADEIAHRQIAEYSRRFEEARGSDAPLETGVRILRDVCRGPLNSAWFELMVAGRTDPALRDVLGPALLRYGVAIMTLASATMPELAAVPYPKLEALLFALVFLFDGETLAGAIVSRPEIEEQRLALAIDFVRHAIAH